MGFESGAFSGVALVFSVGGVLHEPVNRLTHLAVCLYLAVAMCKQKAKSDQRSASHIRTWLDNYLQPDRTPRAEYQF